MRLFRYALFVVMLFVLSACGNTEVSKEQTGRAYTDESDRTVPIGKLFVQKHSDVGYYLVYTEKYSDGSVKLSYEKVEKAEYDKHGDLKEEKYVPFK